MEKAIQQLLDDTQNAYKKSLIQEKGWSYAISSTRLTKNSTVIVGFNWGLGKKSHEPQEKIPEKNFRDLYDQKELGSLQRTYKRLQQYLPKENIDNFVQTNFCFFRSDKEKSINPQDLALSTPLFEQLLKTIQPQRIIGFSNKLRYHFITRKNCMKLENFETSSNAKSVHAAKGIVQIGVQQIPFFFLPHPNYPIIEEARKKTWEFCFSNIKTLS